MSLEHQSKLTGTPIAEIEIDLPLVSRLLAAQHPDLAHLPLQWIDAGWDNVMFRLGDRFSVRLPRLQIAASRIIKLAADKLSVSCQSAGEIVC